LRKSAGDVPLGEVHRGHSKVTAHHLGSTTAGAGCYRQSSPEHAFHRIGRGPLQIEANLGGDVGGNG
jgi:hypothetical protein